MILLCLRCLYHGYNLSLALVFIKSFVLSNHNGWAIVTVGAWVAASWLGERQRTKV